MMEKILPKLIWHLDEPRLGQSYPNFYMAKLASKFVKVVLSGDYELKSIEISDAAKKEAHDIINDLIIASFNNAKENLKKKSAEELSKVTGGLNLPLDFKLPF